ncbi:MAG TPA: ribbon-helix-helix domain-containing protein [Thermoanaerobaculia bacterium]|nr:ribbon-helix-helix domain-containing protein [Thermoanaerobaculia bacterium]
MASKKTAVTLGEATYARLDALAREMSVPRSRVLALAVEQLLERHDALSLTAAIDRAYRDLPSAAEKQWLGSARRKHRHLVENEW